MKLFGSATSPYARKARVLIHEKQLPVEFVVEDPWMENSPVIAKNPLSKVPVLEIAPGQYYFESALVVHFLDHVDGKSLTPTDPPNYWQAQWWQALGNGIIDAAVARVLAHGAELIGEVVQYEDSYRLAYIRGPEGITVGLSEQVG
jgi:glutathione S-transferase